MARPVPHLHLSALLCVLCVSAVNPSLAAQSSDSRNAAVWYERAFDAMGRLTPADQRTLRESDAGWPMTPEGRSVLAKAQLALSFYQRGSQQPYMDFQLDRSQGFALLLPHLGQLRQLAILASIDAQVRLHDGDTSGAAERIAAIYRTAGQFADDRIIISSLVGQAIFSLGEGATRAMVDHGALGPLESATLLRALESLPQRDPFGHVEAVIGEHELIVNTLPQLFGDEEGLAEFIMILEDPPLEDFLDLTPDEFQHHVDLLDGYMDRVVEVFATDDLDQAKEQWAVLERELLADEHGMLARHLSPAYGRMLDRRSESEALLAARIEMLRELAGGEVDPVEIANAAAWYLRAIALIERTWDEDQLAALREHEPRFGEELPKELSDALAASQEIVDLLRDGSLRRRCDFSIARPAGAMPFIPEYAAGMRDALRLLLFDAQRLFVAEDGEAAADRLAVSLRIIAHLSGDEQIVISLLAHRAFAQLYNLIEAAVEADSLAGEQISIIGAALDRIGRADPFGYVAAARNTRSYLVDRRSHYARSDERKEAIEALINLAGNASIDDLPALLTLDEAFAEAIRYAWWWQQMQQAGITSVQDIAPAYRMKQPRPRDDGDAFAALGDVIDVEAVRPLRHQAFTLAAELVAGDIEAVTERNWSVIADVQARMREARSDLRRAATVLQILPMLRRAVEQAGDSAPESPAASGN
jgi:hypothetical protein